MIIVSSCLAGLNSRYDGGNLSEESIITLVREGKAIPVCPEQLGGLPTPRSMAEIVGGDGKDVLEGKDRVLTEEGEDVTDFFIRGAYEVLKLIEVIYIDSAILKDGSPSCGVYNIRRKGKKVKGIGVTAALLKTRGINIEAI